LQFSGGQPLRGDHVKADPRKVHVHFADRGIFVPEDDFIGRPGQYGAMYRIAIVVGGHADPVAALKPHIMCFSGPSVGLIRLIDLGDLDRFFGRHVIVFAVSKRRNSLIPGVNDGRERNEFGYFRAAILPCKPKRVIC
jgi:hypothetical protein